MKKIYLNTLKPEEVIKRLRNGEVIYHEDRNITIKMIDNIIIGYCEKQIRFNEFFAIDEVNDFYFEEPEEFKVDVTGLYKTRDGRIAFVSAINDIVADGIINGDQTSTRWYLSGKYCGNSDNDLVEYIGGKND